MSAFVVTVYSSNQLWIPTSMSLSISNVPVVQDLNKFWPASLHFTVVSEQTYEYDLISLLKKFYGKYLCFGMHHASLRIVWHSTRRDRPIQDRKPVRIDIRDITDAALNGHCVIVCQNHYRGRHTSSWFQIVHCAKSNFVAIGVMKEHYFLFLRIGERDEFCVSWAGRTENL